MKRVTSFLAALLLSTGSAFADPIYDSSALAELTGSRSNPAGSGIVIGGGTATSATIGWVISLNQQTNLFHYAYTLSVAYPATTANQGISHLILDLSDNCASVDDGCVLNVQSANTLSPEYGAYATNGNPGFPGSITGIKWNVTNGGGVFAISFDSPRVPVYGDFYAKAGNGGTNGYSLWNSGATNHASQSVVDFIARPDSLSLPACEGTQCGSTVPVPGTIALLGLGLLSAVGISKTRSRRR